MTFGNFLKILTLIATALGVLAGTLETINPKIAGIAAVVVAVIMALTKAITDNFPKTEEPPTE